MVTKISAVGSFFLSIQHDSTPNNMADRDNGDDKNGRKKKNFSIDDDAFASDDDRDFMDDDEFEPFINPSQKKNIRKLKPKDFSKQEAECIVRRCTKVVPWKLFHLGTQLHQFQENSCWHDIAAIASETAKCFGEKDL